MLWGKLLKEFKLGWVFPRGCAEMLIQQPDFLLLQKEKEDLDFGDDGNFMGYMGRERRIFEDVVSLERELLDRIKFWVALWLKSDGRPAPHRELTNEFNVLEAGLWNSISLNKGCYKGQETISRLITYDGIKQRLWGISLSSAAEPGSPVIVDGKKVGKLTSCVPSGNGSQYVGLGYIKKRAASKGNTVIVGETVTGTLVEVPYLARQQPLSSSSSS
ncbi:YgfZ/GcvT conserved site [Parasponia andersonii]|uniref:YgfZ/GcvT conserved site n=1 Tax=Parasponia andersonii TaxID=3476 RepID=A0A2P5D526_PARAD|nr:YgfZ/GcvT conserved site [Parasponia andersonii]